MELLSSCKVKQWQDAQVAKGEQLLQSSIGFCFDDSTGCAPSLHWSNIEQGRRVQNNM